MTATLAVPAPSDDAHLDPLRDALVDAVGTEYEIVRLLGRGGMGAVYLARDRALERLVAIKVLPPSAGTDAAAIERFRREARTVAALQHGGIVPLYAFGERRGLCWFVMGYVRGESLAARLEREGALDPDTARTLLAQLADALDHAHRQGVVHRDIKPDNVLIDDTTGRAQLTDFGIARAESARAVTALTQTGAVMGTPHYMSPEQATAEPTIDGRSDLYSLGVVAYETLAGRLPFTGGSFRELILQHVSVAPPPLSETAPHVPTDLAAVVMRCLAKEPAERPADAGALRAALGGAAYDDEALSYELTDITHLLAGTIVTVGIIALLVGSAALAGWSLELLQPLLGAIPVALVMATLQIREARRRGFGWDVIRRVVLLPPRWWFFPWPTAWRRSGDVHARLPRPIRIARALNVLVVLSFLVFLPVFAHAKRQIDLDVRSLVPSAHDSYLLRGFGTMPLVGDFLLLMALIAVIVVAYVTMLVLAARVGRQHGIGWLDWQRFAYKPTDAPFWRDARIKVVLIDPRATPVTEPATPQELVTRIVAATRTTTPSGAHTGADAAGAARRLLEAITAIDRELESLARTAPAEQLERIEAELVLLEHEGGDGEAIALLEAQRDTGVRARERAAQLTARRLAAVGELEALWRDARRLGTPDGDIGALQQALQTRAEAIDRAWPARARGTTRRSTAAAVVAVVVCTLASAVPSVAAAPATPAHARVAALLDRDAIDSARTALAALADAGDQSVERWRLEGRAAVLWGNGARRMLATPAIVRALRAYGEVVARDSSDVTALEHLVWLHRLAPTVLGGRDGRSAQALARLEQVAPYRATLLRAYLASLDGDAALALTRFRALTAAHPDSAPGWFGLGEAAARHDHLDLAWAAFARYRALAPRDPAGDYQLGLLAAHHGLHLAEGEAALRRYLAAPWHTGRTTHDIAWWRLGEVQEKAGRPAEARQAFAKALALAPGDADYTAALRRVTPAAAP